MKITKAEVIRRIKATGRYYGIKIFSDGNIVGVRTGENKMKQKRPAVGRPKEE